VVIIGYGRVGKHLVQVLRPLDVDLLVIETDVEEIDALNELQIAALYGDAANSDLLIHAGLEHARALVITIPEESSAGLIVAAARQISPRIPVIVRAGTEGGVRDLADLGADHIVHPELEGGLEMVHHTLLQLGYPLREVHEFAESVRRDHYDIAINSAEEHRSLHDMLAATDSIEITWMNISDDSPLADRTLEETNIRAHTGASVVALIRENMLIANPKSSFQFRARDRVGLIGEKEQIQNVRDWLAAESGKQDSDWHEG
jgi:CPA2 family monovalent cation:H+ antiporter-2